MSNLDHTIKTYVQVDVEFDDNGIMRPRRILWEDGQYFEIDKVLDIRSASAAKAGGQGDRYTIRLSGQTTFLLAYLIELHSITFVCRSILTLLL